MLFRLAHHVKDVVQGKTQIGVMRSPHWRSVEQAHLKLFPACAVCGTTEGCQIHHIFPFHYCVLLGRPDLELDQRNLITLCESNAKESEQNHHLLVGHLDDFKSSNLQVVQDAAKTFHRMSSTKIEASKVWQTKKANKLKPFHEMTEQDKREFKELMNKTFPLKSLM